MIISEITTAVLGLKIISWVESIVTFKNTLLLSKFIFIIRISHVFNPNNVIIHDLDIPSKKGFNFHLCPFLRFDHWLITGNTGSFPFRKLNVSSLTLISASNSTKLLTPSTKSTLLCMYGKQKHKFQTCDHKLI